jgi:hypothetical protein
MPRLLLTALLLLASFAASAADDLKVMRLEQDVRDLQRQVFGLTRQVEELQRRPIPGVRTERAYSPPATASAAEWVDAAKWNRLKSGMSELDVISTLGPPTTIREESGSRVLRYAMEIGTSGFLGGSVTLRDRVVVEVRKPALQ